MVKSRIIAFVACLAIYFTMTIHSRAEDTKLTVMVFRGGQNLPLFAAQAKGFFAKRGLSIEVKFASSAAELPVGLADGRWQIIHSTSDNAVGIVKVNKLDVALIIGGDTAFNHVIVQPDIQTLAELRGKTIVLDTANSGYAYMFYALLKKNGLNKGDYTVKTVGATPRRLEAMQKDKDNKAAVLNPPFAFQAVQAGLKDMGTTVKMMGPYQGTAGYTLRSWAKDNRDTLVKYLQAYIEGLRWVLDPANKEEATKLLSDRLKLPPDIAASVYAVVADKKEGFAKDGKFDLEGFKNVLELRAEYEGGTSTTPEQYLDLSYYQRALTGL
jgi:ABC-type nitrate/sulfonate/bicarbonate transport system substrate-binding protein